MTLEEKDQIEIYRRAPEVDLTGLARRSIREKIVILKPHQVSISDEVKIGARTVIHPFTVLEGKTRIGKNCIIGPYAHVCASVVEDGAVVAHTQLVRSHFGGDAKAKHFSYIGDAVVGRGANIGAGTVTANYDGKKKNKTVIGDGAFTGSNCTIIAPLQVGKSAYIAAGSVVTDDVPPYALALGRSRQVNKLNWIKRKKKKTRNT